MDRYINATQFLDKLDADIKMLDNCHTWEASAISYMERTINEVIENGGEFRPVVHAHWIEHEADFGESLYCECSSCHDSTGIECKLFCGACGAIMDEQTITVKDY